MSDCLAGEVQMLAEHVGRYKRQAATCDAEAALPIGVMIDTDLGARFDYRTAVNNCAIDRAILADLHSG